MVVEHLHDPLGSLQKLLRWTRPGGWIAISVPNGAALEFRWFRNAWYALQLPTHLFHYTPPTLGRLLMTTGWQVQRVMHQRILTNLVNSSAYRLLDHHRIGAALALLRFGEYDYSSYLLYPFAVALSAIGQTGRMTVWAQRPLEQH
jgi:predicted SAM-dependent methyltransferase